MSLYNLKIIISGPVNGILAFEHTMPIKNHDK